jgi:hypothetical protein
MSGHGMLFGSCPTKMKVATLRSPLGLSEERGVSGVSRVMLLGWRVDSFA